MSAKRQKLGLEEEPESQFQNIDEKRPSNFGDLPFPIFVDIILKLSTRSITLCKSVCKSWLAAISDPEFVNVHLAQAKTYPLVRDTLNYRMSRSVYLIEPEDGLGFHRGYCWCGSSRCWPCRANMNVRARLKLPIRNFQEMLSLVGEGVKVSDAIFDLTRYIKRKNLIKLKEKSRYVYNITNSCRGLLCLSPTFGNDPVIVCNPVTGEFVDCPACPGDELVRFKFCAVGFGRRDGRFKVVKSSSPFSTAEVLTLGSDTWRSYDVSELELDYLDNAVWVEGDGSVNWLQYNYRRDSLRMVSFDVDSETFRAVPVPGPPCEPGRKKRCLAIAAIDGRICTYDTNICGKANIWVRSLLSDSWDKLCTVDVPTGTTSSGNFCYCHPLTYLHDGAMMMFHNPANQIGFYDKLGSMKFKCLNFRGIKSVFEAIAYTPSFVSIKEIMKGTNIEVLNVNSRCGNLKLVEETYPLMFGGPKK